MNPNSLPTSPLTRSKSRILAGVCAGFAERFGVAPWAVRVLWLLFMLAWGTGLALYIICFFCIPNADQAADAQRARMFGVCYRLSRSLNVDVAIVRILAVFAALGSLGTFLIIYVVLHFIIPKDASTSVINV